MKIQSAVLSDVGLVRQENQDSSAALPELRLFVVADGMGGHVGGKRASETAVETLREHYGATPAAGAAAADRLREAVVRANRRIFETAASDESLHGMGTTLVALLVDEDRATIAHVGDSRAYRLRDGRVEQLTADHSLVADLLRGHEISEDEAKVHPYRHVLTRALGTASEVEVETREVDVRAGDVYVLCTDGVSGMVGEEQLEQLIVAHRADPDELCRSLVDAAKAGGGRDNATVVVVRCSDD